jgi:Insertion element 4 transposase N-terminal
VPIHCPVRSFDVEVCHARGVAARRGAGAAEPDSDDAGVREAVLAGPGMVAGLGEQARSWLFERLVGCDAVAAALDSCGHVDVRRRALPGDVTVKVVLGLGLFSTEGYDSVLAKVFPAVAAPVPGGAVPTGPALSQARARMDEKVFQAPVPGHHRPTRPGAGAGGVGVRA